MELTEKDLTLKKIPDLKALCKEKNLTVSGSKAELIARLLGNAPPPKKAKTKAQKSMNTNILDKDVFKHLTKQEGRKSIVIKRNLHGHFEHPETHFIFSMQKKVIGIQGPHSPDPQPLTTKDLENVYKYHFELDESVIIQDEPGADITNESDQHARLEELYTQTTLEE